MNALEARDVMLTVFKTVWDTLGTPAGSLVAIYADVPGAKPASEKLYARVTIRHAIGKQSSLSGLTGTKLYDNKGILWVQVYAPIGDGSVAGYAASQSVVNAFREAKTAVIFRNVRMNEAGTSGAFERFDVKIDFEYEDVR